MKVPCSSNDDIDLLRALRAGDEGAFVTLVRRHNGSMLWMARSFVANRAVAEEVVQDTWMAVVHGIDKFEGRSSLKSWMIGILVNRARSAGAREHRCMPAASDQATDEASRFDEGDRWIPPTQHFTQEVEDRLSAKDLLPTIRSSLDALPASQRQVVTLRDVEGLHSKEVCELLEISEGNQRILLHRARSRLRRAVEAAF
jgi:RNA polymerase sigma-70 factor (ECF subfamily)